MRSFRWGSIAFAVIVAAACRESTAPKTSIYPISWVEWPTAVVPGEAVVLRVSAPFRCGLRISYDLYVSGNNVHVSAISRGAGLSCPELGNTGAGYDTLLTLPALSAGPGGLPTVFNVWATVSSGFSTGGASDKMIGQFTLQFSSPDTTPRFAGNVILTVDSLGCWRAIPASEWPEPRWVFAKPLSLVPDRSSWQAFLYGHMVAVSPPVCGNSVAIEPSDLEVDLSSNPLAVAARGH